MKANIRNIFWLILFLSSFGVATADERRSAEQSAIGNLVSFMRTIQQINGSAPTNWDQIKQAMHPDTADGQRLIERLINPLQERYVFVTNKIAMVGYDAGNVILIRTEPIEQIDDEITREGRYAIATNETGFYSTWVSETNVQKMFAQSGVTNLPEPEPIMPLGPVTQSAPVLHETSKVTSETVIPQVQEKTIQSPVAASNSATATTAKISASSKKWPFILIAVLVFVFVALIMKGRKK